MSTAERIDVVSSLNGLTGDVLFKPKGTTATVAALALVASASVDGHELGDVEWVESVGDFFGLRTSALTVDSITVVNALGRSGCQWVRLGITNRTWAARTSWLVDPQNVAASDENTGLSGSPLATLSEVARRLAGVVIPTTQLVTATLNSDCVSTDKPVWTHHHQQGSNSGDGFFLLGVPTVLYTGTVTGRVQQTQGNVSAADDNQITDSAIPVSYTASGLIGAGLLWQRTNGTPLFWHGLKDLGSKTARMTDAVTTAGAITLLTVGDTYTVSRLPKIYDQSFPARENTRTNCHLTVQFCDSRPSGTSVTAPYEVAGVTWDRCTWGTATTFINAQFLNCATWATCGQIGPGTVFMRGGAVAGGTLWSCLNGGTITFSGTAPTHFQGVSLSNAQNGCISATLLAFYDCTGDCLIVANGSTAFMNNVKGKGNAAKMLRSNVSTCISYNHTTSPPCSDAQTSDPLPIRAGQTSIATASLPLLTEITIRMCGVVDNA